MSKTVSPKAFVHAWQTSNSAKEVAEKTGMELAAVRARAHYYRTEKNVPLKRMPKGGRKPNDWSEIADYAEFLAQKT